MAFSEIRFAHCSNRQFIVQACPLAASLLFLFLLLLLLLLDGHMP